MGVEPALPFCPLQHPFCFLSGAQQDNNWVNLLPTSSGGLLLTDSPFLIRFDYETLTVQGGYPWTDGAMAPKWLETGRAPAVGSAHPLKRPRTESTYIGIMLEASVLPLVKDAIAVYSIDTVTMQRALIAHVPVKSNQYLHSYGVSENYVVLPCNLGMGLPHSLEPISSF